MALTFRKLAEVKVALQIAGAEPLPIGFALAKNLVRVDRKMEEVESVAKEIRIQYAEKGEDGKPKVGPDGQYVYSEENKKLLEGEIDKLNADDSYSVEWHKIKESSTEGLKIRGDALAVLMQYGIVIEDPKG